MKKFLISFACICSFLILLGLVHSATIGLTDVPNSSSFGPQVKSILNANWDAIQVMFNFTGHATVTTSGVVTVTGASDTLATASGYTMMRGPASTYYYVQAGSTEPVGTAIVFPKSLSNTKYALTVTYDNTIVGRNEAAYYTSKTATGFTPQGYAASTVSWIAIGI